MDGFIVLIFAYQHKIRRDAQDTIITTQSVIQKPGTDIICIPLHRGVTAKI